MNVYFLSFSTIIKVYTIKPRLAVAVDFPTITLELKETELADVLTPEDFAVGQYVLIYNRFVWYHHCV